MNHSVLEIALGIGDTLAGIVLLWATMRITTAAGFNSPQKRWALFRRVVYASQSIALFGLGVIHLDSYAISDLLKLFFQFVVMVGVVVFPLLRALDLITQDQFKSVDGTIIRHRQ